MKKLTCIIPFLNEHIEVFRTVKSIRDTVGEGVDIILLNDMSTDEIQYKVISNQFNCKYILNNSRQGVAGCRDLGVSLCETDYCILLDAHMRFYTNDWHTKIIETIDINPRRIYCTGCVPLWWPHDGKKVSNRRTTSTGAFLQTSFTDWHSSFEPKWLPYDLQGVSETPLVLGATYAFKKDYYIYLGGLHGLKFYGSDEAWISLKSWALGDGCAVISDIGIGHLFREKHPYKAPHHLAVFNKLLIICVICPEKKHWITDLLKQGGEKTMIEFKKEIQNIMKIRSWFYENENKGWKERFNNLNSRYCQDWETI